MAFMRTVSLLLLLIALSPAGLAANTVQIQQVGLEGYYLDEPAPTRVEVLLTNPSPQPQVISLSFRIFDLAPVPEIVKSENQFQMSVNLGPGEQRTISAPLLIVGAQKPAIEVEARDASGKVIGRDQLPLEHQLIGYLVAIVCAEQDVCKTTQSEITFSGSAAEQTQSGKTLKFVWVRQPPADWWAYSAAKAIVVAAPLKQLSEAQRIAIEGAARQGRKLILIEDQVQDSEFLSPYRKGPPDDKPRAIGDGTLFRVRRLSGRELGKLVSGRSLTGLMENEIQQYLGNDELSWVLKRLATSFRFPRLGPLLAWLAAYILIIGLLNFAILQRIKRREWGWITIPAGAILFSVLLYWWSARERPKTFGIDQIEISFLDDRSPIAASEDAFRISSPKEKDLSVAVHDLAVFNGSATGAWPVSFSSLTAAAAAGRQGWDAQVGPPWQVKSGLLKWSYLDLKFRGMEVLPGTVHWNGETKLRNDTGRIFSQAIFVDKDKVYFLGPMAAGAEIDLKAARQTSLSEDTGRTYPFVGSYPTTLGEGIKAEPSRNQSDVLGMQKEMQEWRQLPYRPFELVEMIRSWPHTGGNVFDSRSGVFFGLSDEPAPGASLEGVPFVKKSHALTIVSFEPST